MAFLCSVILSILTALFFLLEKYKTKNQKNKNIVSHKSLAKYISQQNKKRKTNIKSNEKTHKNPHFPRKIAKIKNKNKFKYMYLEESFLSLKTKKFQTKNTTYVEHANFSKYKKLQELSVLVDKKINNSKIKYRAINNQCVIETVAESFANAILIEDKFDVFSCFKKLSSIVKIYKKEAEILNYLLAKQFIELFMILQTEVYEIKQKILSAKNIKKLPKRKTCPEITYGIYLFNQSATTLILKNNLDVKSATTTVLEKLDDILYRQTILFRYLTLIEKTF